MRRSESFAVRFFLQFLFRTGKSRRDHSIHIVITVFSETSAEDHLILLLRQLPVLRIQRSVLLIIYRIVRFIPWLPLGAVLPADNSFRIGSCSKLEPLVLNNPRPRRLAVRVNSLPHFPGNSEYPALPSQNGRNDTPAHPDRYPKVSIDRTGIDHLLRQRIPEHSFSAR